MPAALRRGGGRGAGGVGAVRLVLVVLGRRGRGELQAAGPHAERLPLLRDVQQLDLPAGQDEVAVEQLRGASPPLPHTPHAPSSSSSATVPPVLQLRGLQDVGRGVPQGAAPSPAPAQAQAAAHARRAARLQRRRGRERRGRQQVQLPGALSPAGVVVAVGGEEDLGGAFLVREDREICECKKEAE